MVVPATGAAGGREGEGKRDASCDGWQLIISIEMLARARAEAEAAA